MADLASHARTASMAVQIFVCLNTNVLHLLPNSTKVPSQICKKPTFPSLYTLCIRTTWIYPEGLRCSSASMKKPTGCEHGACEDSSKQVSAMEVLPLLTRMKVWNSRESRTSTSIHNWREATTEGSQQCAWVYFVTSALEWGLPCTAGCFHGGSSLDTETVWPGFRLH